MKKINILNYIIIVSVLFVMFERAVIACSPPEPGCSSSSECGSCEECNSSGFCESSCTSSEICCGSYCDETSNQPPTAAILVPSNPPSVFSNDFVGPYPPFEIPPLWNWTISFYSDSFDNDDCNNSIIGYQWYSVDPDENGERLDEVSEPWNPELYSTTGSVSETFTKSGTWTIILFVKDDEGSVASMSMSITVPELNIYPDSGPIGTVATISCPPGMDFFDSSSTVSISGIYTPDGYSATSSTTINYPYNKVYYNSSYPDQVQVVIGEVFPSSSWLISNSQVYKSNTGTLSGSISSSSGGPTLSTDATFQIYSESELGTLDGSTFTAVPSIDTFQSLMAQVLIKDDGLGSEPASFPVTLQSYDSDDDPITSPPSGDYADTSLTFTVYKVTSGGIPGYHTYRSSPDDLMIVPSAYKIPYDICLNTESLNKYIYIVEDGSLQIEY